MPRVITDPAEFKDLEAGTYVVAGDAASEVIRQTLKQSIKRLGLLHKPEDNGLSQCIWCDRPLHRVAYYVEGTGPFNSTTTIVRRAWRHNPIPRLKRVHDNDRTHCSSCSRPFPAYELKPGDGRCRECQP